MYMNVVRITHNIERPSVSLQIFKTGIFSRLIESFKTKMVATDFRKTFLRNFYYVLIGFQQ